MSGEFAAVLFDMDGTLVETESIWFAAEREVFGRLGGEWLPTHQELFVGGPLDLMITHMIALTESDSTEQAVHDDIVATMVRRLNTGPVHWMPGARELVQALDAAQVPKALVSASLRAMVDAVLSHVGTEHFASTVSGDEVKRSKPFPDPYLRAAEILDVDPAHCLAIEDSPTGVASARAAGCTVLAIPSLKPIDVQPGIHLRTTLEGLAPTDLAAMVTSPS